MTGKVSTEKVSPHKKIGDNLNYNIAYVYDTDYSHRLINAGDRYYKYDANGNVICEQDGSFDEEEPEVYHKINQEAEDVYSTDYGWGLFRDDPGGKGSSSRRYRRTYTWDERNQLISTSDPSYTTTYIYGQDGQRTNKFTTSSETLYFNKMWIIRTDAGSPRGQAVKNVYLGDTRIVTKLRDKDDKTTNAEVNRQYYYHSDHLGSATLITDENGVEYQRIEYTPYGETWVEKTSNVGLEYLPYKFTGKEMDEETGLYYYGARYLDPKYSRWISTDPALGEYVPQAPINDEAKKHNQNLPGMGGLFNTVNLSLYHYAGNNPIKYVDPDGRSNEDDFISCFKTNLKNNNDITKALLVTISQNKSKDFSFSQDNVKKLIKELNISLEPVAKKLLNNLDSISYRFDSASKLGKLKIKMQNETSIDLTDRMNVKIFKETEYSIKFESDKKFTLEAPKTSTPPKINIFGIKAKKIEIGFTATNKFAVFKVNGISLLKYIQ